MAKTLKNSSKVRSGNKQPAKNKKDPRDIYIEQLEKELGQVRKDILTITKDQEAAKEELQSTNQELITVNQKLYDRNDELDQLSKFSESVITILHEPLLLLDKEFNIKMANKAFYKTFKITEEETLGKVLFELQGEQWNITGLRKELQKIRSKKGPMIEVEIEHTFPGIGTRDICFNIQMLDKEGAEPLILLALDDITERKGQPILKESEKKFRDLVYGLPVAVYLCDEEGYITLYNDLAVKLWGRKPEIGKDKWSDVWKGFTSEGIKIPSNESPIAIALKERCIINPEIIIEQPDGQRRNMIPYPKIIYDQNNKITGVINTMIDVTKQVNSQKLMQQHADRLKSFFMQTPALLCILKGTDHIFELANPLYREFVNDPNPIGKKLIDVLPEVKEQGYIEALDKVYNTGESYMRNEATITLGSKEGKSTLSYVDFSYQPYNNELGKTEGVLVFAYDVTEKVLARKQLEQNAEMTQELFVNSPAFVSTLIGPTYIFDFVNPAYQKLFGSRQILGKPFMKAFPELKGQNFDKILHEVYQTGEIYMATEKLVWLAYDEGLLPEERYFNFSFQPVYDEYKKITGILEFGYEVTEQVNAKKLVQQYADRMKSFFMQTPAILCILKGPEYVFELANPMYRKFINNPDPIGKKVIDVLPGLKQQGFMDIINRVYNTGQSFTGTEVPFKFESDKEDSPDSYVDLNYQTYKDEFGKTEGILIFAYDVTEKVLARRQLEQNAKLTQDMYMNSPAFMCTLKGPKHIYDLVNPACQKMFGSKKIVGKPIAEVLSGQGGESISKAIDKVYQTGEMFVVTEALVWVAYDEGLLPEERYFNFSGQPMYDENKKITAIQVIGYEVTEQVNAKKSVQQHADRLKAFFMQTPALLCILKGPDYVFELANPLYRKFVNDPNPIGKKLTDVLPEVKEQGYIEALDKVYKAGESYMRNEATIIVGSKKGKSTLSYLDISYQAYKNEFGKTGGVLIFAYDVTEKVLARKQLEQNAEMLQDLFMNSPAFMCTLNGPKHIYDLVNPACQKIFGSKQIVGKPIAEVLSGQGGERISKAIDKVYETGEMFVATDALMWVAYDEGLLPEERYFNFSGQPMYDENKEITAIQVIGYEVTQEVLAKKKNEAHLRLLLESIPQITISLTARGKITFFNQYALDYFGLTMEELITGGGWQKIIHPDELKAVISKAEHCLISGKDFYKEARLKRASDGKYRWHLMRARPIKDDKEDAIISWVGVASDIQEQKIKEERKDEFISIASHEMKTPLTSTKGYLQLLERMLDGNNTEAAYLANKALGSVKRLNNLITELLEVSKIQYGKLNFNLTTFDFNKMVDETINDQRNASPGYTILEKGAIASEITGDMDRLQQVVINMVSNGIKYSPGKKKIAVTIKEKDGKLIFSVKDNGIGISKENFENVFKRYFRVEEQAMRFPGMGIGLYISNEIIKKHGGRMWVESEREKGSTFNFSIPIGKKP